jgi:hypothetical protein
MQKGVKGKPGAVLLIRVHTSSLLTGLGRLSGYAGIYTGTCCLKHQARNISMQFDLKVYTKRPPATNPAAVWRM